MDILFEKKDHLINKIPNLSLEQKAKLIQFFNKHPEKESLIDWNKLNTLTWDNFLQFFDSKEVYKNIWNNQKIKAENKEVKEHLDYSVVYFKDNVVGIMPFNHRASVLFASSYILGSEGKWCIAQRDTMDYWKEYTSNNGIFIFFLNLKKRSNFTKVALEVFMDNKKTLLWDADDDNHQTSEKLDLTGNKDISKAIDLALSLKDRVVPFELTIDYLKESGKVIKNSDGTIDVIGDVDIYSCDIKDFNGIKFNRIIGNFDCSYNNLTSLEGCPKEIQGNFDCNNNHLVSLECCPKIISGNFDCSRNNIKTLKFYPNIIKGSFYITRNPIPKKSVIYSFIYGDIETDLNKEIEVKLPTDKPSEFIIQNNNTSTSTSDNAGIFSRDSYTTGSQ